MLNTTNQREHLASLNQRCSQRHCSSADDKIENGVPCLFGLGKVAAVKQDANETVSAYLYRLRQAVMQYGGLTELEESQKEDTKTMTVVSSAAERDIGQETAIKGKQQEKNGADESD
ncbi:hypothetical protein ABVT39_011385 [Epinephelus coioides]